MNMRTWAILGVAAPLVGAGIGLRTAGQPPAPAALNSIDAANDSYARQMIHEDRQIFRDDTFGDKSFWGDQLQLHKAVAGSKFGGVGDGLSPKAALEVGLCIHHRGMEGTIVVEGVPGRIAAGR